MLININFRLVFVFSFFCIAMLIGSNVWAQNVDNDLAGSTQFVSPAFEAGARDEVIQKYEHVVPEGNPIPVKVSDVPSTGDQDHSGGSISGQIVTPDEATNILSQISSKMAFLSAQTERTSSSQNSPEIVSLARALKHSPELIYMYVHTKIDFEPYYGLKKGALGTLLDKSGNSFDQSALLISLLRESGYTARFVRGLINLAGTASSNLFGVSDNANTVIATLIHGGIPVPLDSNGYYKVYKYGDQWKVHSAVFEHVWVEVEIEGNKYVYDPSFKTHVWYDGIDYPSEMGYDKASFLSTALEGATVSSVEAKNVHRENVRSQLETYTTNLVAYNEALLWPDSTEKIVGGRGAIYNADDYFSDKTSLAYQEQIIEYWTDVPAGFQASLRVNHAGIDRTFFSSEIYGHDLIVDYSTSSNAQLKLDGNVVATGNTVSPGTNVDIVLTIDHPYASSDGSYADQVKTCTVQSGGVYNIVNRWGSSGKGAVDHYQHLIMNMNGEDADPRKLELGLALVGYNYLAELSAAEQLSSRISKVKKIVHHQAGVTGQNESVYIDLPLAMVSIIDHNSSVIRDYTATRTASYNTDGLFMSIMESGVIKQTQGIEALSTVRILDDNSRTAVTNDFFFLSPSNFSQYQSQLTGYGSSDWAAIDQQIASGNHVFVPKNGTTTVGDWSGAGYIALSSDFCDLQYLISGGLNGGYASTPKPLDSGSTSTTNFIQLNETVSSLDPIDLASGNYYYKAVDLTLGDVSQKTGLTFGRYYSCSKRGQDGLFGKGWNHSFDKVARTSSNGFSGLGEFSAEYSAAAIVAFHVTKDILEDITVENLAIATMIQNWLMEQLTDNVVNITDFAEFHSFTKLPDGSYIAPPGESLELSVVDNEYHLRTKHGHLTMFDKETGQFKEERDTYGNVLQSTIPVMSTALADQVSGTFNVSNAFGRSFTLTLTDGRVTRVADGTGREVSYSYDSEGNLEQYTDALGQVTKYEYDLPGRMTNIFYPTNPTEPFVTNVYDEFDRVKTQTNANGETYQYFFSGHLNQEIDPLGNRMYWYFNDHGQPTYQEDARGKSFSYYYDAKYRMYKKVEKYVTTTSFWYDAKNNVTTVQHIDRGTQADDTAETVDSYTYTSDFSRVATSSVHAAATIYAYNQFGDIIREERSNYLPIPDNYTGSGPIVVSPNGAATTTLEYDSKGMVVSTTDPTGIVTRYTYDTPSWNLISIAVNPAGENLVTSFSYDTAGNVIGITDPEGRTVSRSYDNMRRMTWETDPAGGTTAYKYDAADNLVEVRKSVDGEQSYVETRTYSPTGMLLSSTKLMEGGEGAPQTTNYAYDAMDRLIQVTDGAGRITSYEYDVAGNLINEKDGNGDSLKQYAYWTSARLSRLYDGNAKGTRYDHGARYNFETYPDGTINRRDRELYDRYVTHTSRDGSKIESVYDSLGRLRRRNLPGGSQQQFTYDLAGRLESAANNEGTVSNLHDSSGRISSTSFAGKTLSFAYSGTSRVTQLTYSDGDVATYTYDALDRLVSVSLNGSEVASYDYDSFSRRTKTELGNGIESSATYGLGARPASLNINWNVGVPATFLYSYDASGMLSSLTTSDDRFAMRSQAASSVAFTPNSLNQVATWGGQAIQYTSNGNLQNDGIQTYTYTALNQLSGVPDKDISYGYDALGRRVRKTVGTDAYTYIWAGKQMVEEHGPDGVRKFVYGAGVDEPICMIDTDGSVYYFHQDASKSVIALSDENGAVVETYAYTPYGKPFVNETGSTPKSPFLFSGRWYEADAGVYYYRARHYHPELRKFLQADPLGYEDGMNMYAYVHNNPVNFYDPDGTIAWVPVIGAALGAAYNGYNNWDTLSGAEWWGSVALGAVTGAVSTMGAGALSSMTIGGMSTAANEAGNQWIRSGRVDNWQAVGVAGGVGLIGASAGVLGKSVGRNIVSFPRVERIPARPLYNYGNLGALAGSYAGSTLAGSAFASPSSKRGK